MAELFRKNGFATGAFVGAFVLDSTWGIDQGFDTYYDNFKVAKEQRADMGSIQRKAEEVYERATAWLDQHGRKRFFLWTHFYDPHTPYEPPKEFADQYPGRPYVAEIAYTDSIVGKLLAYLDQHDLREKTIILLTGDHGESLGEHRETTHAFFIYDATLQVPMILSAPFQQLQNKIIQQQARSIDIMPTLLQLAGVQVPDAIQGRSLLHLIFDAGQKQTAPSYAESYYPQFHFGWSRLLALRTGDYKYIDSSRPELYDLKNDPREQHNLYEERKEIALQMKAELRKWERSPVQAEAVMHPGAVDDETHEKLAALGYVGAFTGPVDADPKTLPDPKDKIELFNLMGQAREDSLSGKREMAIEKFQRALQQDANIVDAHFMLGNEFSRMEKYPEAIEEYRKALELKPDYDFAIINLANTYRKMGKVDEAVAGFQYYLKKNPEKTQVLARIGELYLGKGELDTAMGYFERALKADPETSWVYNDIGVVYLKKKSHQKAEDAFRKAIELNPEINMVHFNLAQLYESEGKMKQAEELYIKELEIAPENFKARFNLGRLYIGQQKIDAGILHLKQVVDHAPEFPLGYLFLAQAYVEANSHLEEAIELANKGLSLQPDPEYKPLGHLVLADIYNRMGRRDLEMQQLRLARQ
jgi:tetratricopeptide (TPR) repeat protein